MSHLSRSTAFELISTWSTDDVIEVLKKNGLEDCCAAVQKRQTDGEELLHLTESKLMLWRQDLSRPQMWSLWEFIEKLNRSPEDHVSSSVSHNVEEPIDDSWEESGSWGSDFTSDEDDEHGNQQKNENVNISERSTNFRKSLMMFQQPEKLSISEGSPSLSKKQNKNSVTSSSAQDNDNNTYVNLGLEDESQKVSQRSDNTNSLVEKIRKELKIISEKHDKKPQMRPKPNPQSFLHQKVNSEISKIPKKNTIPIEMDIKVCAKPDDLPRPPILKTFDLVANLPTNTENFLEDDEYESFDPTITEWNQVKFGSPHSTQDSIKSTSSISVYEPESNANQEKEDGIYESIPETPEDSAYYLYPAQRLNNMESLPPLPTKPNAIIDGSISSRSIQSIKTERSPEKKTVILSNSVRSPSQLELRATRPLPPPPDRRAYMDFPWYHNVSREQATALIKERALNGYFLLRPSSSNVNNPLALVLWFKDRVYNVPVRRRSDNRYALGSPKVNEQTFGSFEEIVKFYSREELMLNSGGVQTGSTRLTETPPKL